MTADENASIALITLDSAGVPSYTFYVEGTADWQWTESELATVSLVDVGAIHTGSLAVALEPGRAAVASWLRAVRAGGQAFISFDPNVRPALISDLARARAETAELVALAHLVKVSEEDLHELYPGQDPLAIATEWANSGPETVIVTHGPAGASAVQPRRPGAHHAGALTVHRGGAPVAVVDTVGAGDAFSAGLLAWLVAQRALRPGATTGLDASDLAAWLDFANQVAAVTCSRPGADPPRRSELTGRLSQRWG